MFFSKSTGKPAQTIIKHHGPIHDGNEDILRIIKLYNQGSMRNMNNEPLFNIRYPYLLKYRSSHNYIIFTAAFGILTSIYASYSLTLIASYVIDHQIKNERKATQILSDGIMSYALSSFYLFGHLGGFILFGWLGSQVKQRKMILIIGTLTSLITSGAFMASIEYWMLFPAIFFQGLSNVCIWSMSLSLIADIWPTSKLGTMIGLFCGLFPLGMTLGLTVGAIFFYVDHKCSFFCALALSCISFFLQLILIEKATLPANWLDAESQSATQNEAQMESFDFKNNQHNTLDAMEERGMWSKSSSMTTINLKDQPVIFEKESESNYKQGNSSNSRRIKNYTIYRLVTSFHLVSLLYQIIIMSAVIGALEPALLEKLLLDLNITNDTYRGVITSTFLFPCALIAFASGWLCDRFGSKIVGLTCIIISIPAFIWIGVPNQNVQSIVSALAIGGVTVAGTSVSILVVTTRLLQKILNTRLAEKDNRNPLSHLTSATIIFAIIGSFNGIGYFIGHFLSKLYKSIGFFWLCFLLAMLLFTCVPFIVYHSRSKKVIKSNSGLSQNAGKKSIINNTRPESFAESMYMSDSDDDDDATTIGSLSARSVCCETMERKSSVIVIP